MNRVVITGAGVISALGNDLEEFSVGLRQARHCVAPLDSLVEGEDAFGIGARVSDYNPAMHFSEKQLTLLDLSVQYVLIAARQAAKNSGLDFRAAGSGTTGAIIGTSIGAIGTIENALRRHILHAARAHPATVPRAMTSSSASHISMEMGITGPAFVVSSACSSSNHAIGIAFQMIRSGAIVAAIAGGTEATFNFGLVKAWKALRVLSPDVCRPFSKDRKGLVLGDGSAMFVLEEYDHAVARGALIMGEIVGFGMNADAGDIVAPSLDQASAAIAMCLADGGIAPEAVDYVNAHGTGTVLNDVMETAALHRVFGTHAKSLAVSSTKPMHGHALGATGAIELAALLVAMRDGFIPPTLNYSIADPQCDLDYVPNEVRRGSIGLALSNSFAFGGLNAVLAVRRV